MFLGEGAEREGSKCRGREKNGKNGSLRGRWRLERP